MSHELTVASFFSGIGLLDLGLEWAGWRTVSVSEIEPYANRVLDTRFPGVPNLGDIHAITDVPDATLWAGGFPCQPISLAGSQRAQDDDRWLWPAWAGLIRKLRPRVLLLENVSALLAVNDGRAFGDVLGDLASIGYDAEWDCIPAAAVGAPHLRDRVWIIGTLADAEGEPVRPGLRESGPSWERRGRSGDGSGTLADTTGGGRTGGRTRDIGRLPDASGPSGAEPAGEGPDAGERAPVEPSGAGSGAGVRGPLADAGGAGLEGHPGHEPDGARRTQPDRPARTPGLLGRGDTTRWWDVEPNVGRVAHGVPHRMERLRCLGNGVVPQVAEYIGWRIREHLGA